MLLDQEHSHQAQRHDGVGEDTNAKDETRGDTRASSHCNGPVDALCDGLVLTVLAQSPGKHARLRPCGEGVAGHDSQAARRALWQKWQRHEQKKQATTPTLRPTMLKQSEKYGLTWITTSFRVNQNITPAP